MSDANLDSTPPSSAASGWREAGAYGLSHPDGWTIGRYKVSGTDRCLLWGPDGKSQGPYRSVAEAISAFNKLRA
ncbi:hypothetical protein [Burkholderia vietnamiensis]|uniref:hypothetical protein n=1 Tax=Burkholderia vietnamiensis TaxID=60552 RepID=UPI000757A9DA|nr:hypothetical protein [Burkholderia vietnamiensis]KVS18789.1 hypothetical protein WK29_11430 [Burkholderia vietnamiensis]MBR8085543.1 hypothetical protein [Burkholderia vietnamiensis]MDN7820220.1 hypothetical protein [Burkholderia vietnamiensis]UEC05281.1 hypothetical protein LK462_34330 [Burkholderia vietnamiensis]HDR8936304.1 hypothetical protein [Burkholderia vietnamiensis]